MIVITPNPELIGLRIGGAKRSPRPRTAQQRPQAVSYPGRPTPGIDPEDGRVIEVANDGSLCKRRDSRYRSGRSREWLKVKNHAHPAYERALLIALSKRTSSRSR